MKRETNATDRYRGCLLGLACGDAVGTTLEFKRPGTFEALTDLIGGGPFDLTAGEWTDDTSMALCLAESLLERGGFDPNDQMMRYVKWWKEGHLSSNGRCFDIGGTVRQALAAYVESGDPFSGPSDPRTAGNGSIMRLAPIPMFFSPDHGSIVHYAAESSRTTHGCREAVDACRLLGLMIAAALDGARKDEIANAGNEFADEGTLSTAIYTISQGNYLEKRHDEIRGSGYVVECLEAALWCFFHADCFEEAILKAANLGDDADTTAAVCGQLAGAYWGAASIPQGWLAKLVLKSAIEQMADGLMCAGAP